MGRLNLVRMFLFTHRKPQPRSNPEQDAVEFVQPGFPGWARRSGTHATPQIVLPPTSCKEYPFVASLRNLEALLYKLFEAARSFFILAKLIMCRMDELFGFIVFLPRIIFRSKINFLFYKQNKKEQGIMKHRDAISRFADLCLMKTR